MSRNLFSFFFSFLFTLTIVFIASVEVRAEISGTFTVVKGDVKVTSKNGTTENARVGKKVVPSDVITTGKESKAKIVMSDKNIINISPNTMVVIEKYINDEKRDRREASFEMLYGKIRATVKQKYDGEKNKFQVKSPAIIIGVRGTDFLLSHNKVEKKSEVVCFQGKVVAGVLNPKGEIITPVILAPGDTTVALEGAAPSTPEGLSPAEIERLNRESLAAPFTAEEAKAEQGETPTPIPKIENGSSEDDKQKSSRDGDKDPHKNDAPKASGRSSQ